MIKGAKEVEDEEKLNFFFSGKVLIVNSNPLFRSLPLFIFVQD